MAATLTTSGSETRGRATPAYSHIQCGSYKCTSVGSISVHLLIRNLAVSVGLREAALRVVLGGGIWSGIGGMCLITSEELVPLWTLQA